MGGDQDVSLATKAFRLTIDVCLVHAGFFGQFGTVTKVRVSRNKKTGKAKHYAFLEFAFPEVRPGQDAAAVCHREVDSVGFLSAVKFSWPS